jgi:hypothetical protein
MADTELKKLNKTVDEAVNILKLYVGNSAQIKNMNEKQRQAIEKWFDVTEKQEETVKQTRAFTERERDEKGRFLKKQEAFSWSIMGIAKGISGMFMGMTKGIGNSLRGIANGITSKLSNLFSAVKGHFLGLFGEESEWFDILGGIKDSITGFFGWFTRGFIWIFRRTPSWASKIVKTLGKMYSLQIRQMKLDMLGDPKKKKLGFWALLGAALFLAAALVGAWIRKKLMGIELMLRGLRIRKIWDGIKLRIFGLMRTMRGRFGWLDDILKSRVFLKFKNGFIAFKKVMSNFGKWLMKAPLIGKLLKGLRFGFKVLGWPITILFGIIDFIKGWRKDLGDWRSKLITGLKTVFHGLLDLPLEILGWAYDKIVGIFGVESANTGEKLKKWFDSIMGFMFKWGPIGLITDIIKGFTSEGGFKGAFADKVKSLQEPLFYMIDFIAGIWNSFLDWAVEKVKNVPWLGDKVIEMSKSLRMDTIERPSSIESNIDSKIRKNEAKKIEKEEENNKSLLSAIDNQTQATKATNKQTEGAVQAMTSLSTVNQGAGGGGEQKQIPDEVDNWGITMFNYGGGF